MIEEAAEKVFSEVRDFKRWKLWSPWVIMDADCDLAYGSDGNSYSWKGKLLGEGKMEILEARAPERIDFKLTILTPWKSKSDVTIFFEDRGDETKVTWQMNGKVPFFMFMFKNMMVSMIGMDYCRGLAMLKDLVEAGEVPSKLAYREEHRDRLSYVGIEREVSIDDMKEAMLEGIAKVKAWVEQTGAEPSGPPLTIYQKWDMVRGATRFTLGYPIPDPPEELPEGFVSSRMPEMDVYVIEHTGPYRHLANAWSSGTARARNKVFRQNRNLQPFEIYLCDPEETPEEEIVTLVNFPMAR